MLHMKLKSMFVIYNVVHQQYILSHCSLVIENLYIPCEGKQFTVCH
jgi:hypothetical protein